MRRKATRIEQSQQEVRKVWTRKGIVAMKIRMQSQDTFRRNGLLDLIKDSCKWGRKKSGMIPGFLTPATGSLMMPSSELWTGMIASHFKMCSV